MLACAASQLGGTLVPLPGGLGGVEGGALGLLTGSESPCPRGSSRCSTAAASTIWQVIAG